MLPHKHLELLVVPLVQLQTLVLQLLIHLASGLAPLLERLLLLVMPGLHFLDTRRHGLQERQVHCNGN